MGTPLRDQLIGNTETYMTWLREVKLKDKYKLQNHATVLNWSEEQIQRGKSAADTVQEYIDEFFKAQK